MTGAVNRDFSTCGRFSEFVACAALCGPCKKRRFRGTFGGGHERPIVRIGKFWAGKLMIEDIATGQHFYD